VGRGIRGVQCYGLLGLSEAARGVVILQVHVGQIGVRGRIIRIEFDRSLIFSYSALDVAICLQSDAEKIVRVREIR
jgi:hypothetical protein